MPTLGGTPVVRNFMPVTSPPVSGTIYMNSSGSNLLCSLTVTLNATLLVSSLVAVSISQDGVTFVNYATAGIPAGIALSNKAEQIFMQVPYKWYYRVAAINATIGTLVAIG